MLNIIVRAKRSLCNPGNEERSGFDGKSDSYDCGGALFDKASTEY